jgi:hypothetical protein
MTAFLLIAGGSALVAFGLHWFWNYGEPPQPPPIE